MFSVGYEADRADLAAHGTGVDGLLSVGRNGEFDHILMEDIYWRTTRRIRRWLGVDGSGGVAEGAVRTAAGIDGEV